MPHVWASVAEQGGRILVASQSAGPMEAFVRVVTAAGVLPSQAPALWRAHGMNLLGPPLAVA